MKEASLSDRGRLCLWVREERITTYFFSSFFSSAGAASFLPGL